MEKKIGLWASTGAAGSKAAPARPAKVCLPEALPPEVKELERFLLLTGGRLGGWDQYDHEVFLRERAKRSGRDGPPHVPGKRADEVAQHEDWHEKLLLLEEKKREVRPCARVFLRSSV